MAPKVVCVVGPTGCGKTKLGVLLAKAFDGEVVSCDSMQLYRGMVIGTAAPTKAEMDGVPHHMVGIVEPTEDYSAARYAAEAGACVDDILARGKLPVIVGGTGLYMDALLRGHSFAAGQSGGEVRKALYERLDREGIEALWAELEKVDAESAARLHKNDEKRILRALEVYMETGRTISQHNEETKDAPLRYEPVYIGLAYADRERMKEIIDLRVDKMMAEGLLGEVETLLSHGVSASATALQAIGYKECLAYFAGESTAEETAAEIKLRSRQYAKRQLTWLRRNKAINWFYWNDSRDFEAALAFSTKILIGHTVS